MHLRPFGTAALLAVVLLGAACDGDTPRYNPPSPAPTTTAPGPSPSVGRPAETMPPVPKTFPVLLEETQVPQYVEDMVKIHIAAVTNRQPQEVMPPVMAVTGAEPCLEHPKQRTTQVGDAATTQNGVSPTELAPCLYKGKLSILYGPAAIYRMWRHSGRDAVESTFYVVMRDYLALTTQNMLGDYDRFIRACAAGRLVGGLRNKGYLTYHRANAIEAPAGVLYVYSQAYVKARDQGTCDPKWLGQRLPVP